MGFKFPSFYKKKQKVNYVLQSLESLLTIALVYDVTSQGILLHSIERDGIVCFASEKKVKLLQFKLFQKLNKKFFEEGIKLSSKLLLKEGDSMPTILFKDLRDIPKDYEVGSNFEEEIELPKEDIKEEKEEEIELPKETRRVEDIYGWDSPPDEYYERQEALEQQKWYEEHREEIEWIYFPFNDFNGKD